MKNDSYASQWTTIASNIRSSDRRRQRIKSTSWIERRLATTLILKDQDQKLKDGNQRTIASSRATNKIEDKLLEDQLDKVQESTLEKLDKPTLEKCFEKTLVVYENHGT